MLDQGPSPRVRGILHHGVCDLVGERSIPAGAGNPATAPTPTSRPPVHPRGCGESDDRVSRPHHREGPSPRVRGIQVAPRSVVPQERSIPAGAGNPPPCAASFRATTVHPRGCGESVARDSPRVNPYGPSPRVRGIRPGQRVPLPVLGSIPAGAGNPVRRRGQRTPVRVHPRGCGESESAQVFQRSDHGPSPRVRGILSGRMDGPDSQRSIPAGAGNPPRPGHHPNQPGVHPRGCGESRPGPRDGCRGWGPSPRVRGILDPAAQAPGHLRSIPAGAGNPCPRGNSAAP